MAEPRLAASSAIPIRRRFINLRSLRQVRRFSLRVRSGFQGEHLEGRQVKGVRLVRFQRDRRLRGVGSPGAVRAEYAGRSSRQLKSTQDIEIEFLSLRAGVAQTQNGFLG